MNHTKELIEMAHGGDKAAREKLIVENMGLIWSIVKRFAGRGYEQEDLFQIGSIGLIKAVDKFDTSFDVQFSTYAVPMISGEIKRFLRDDGMIKVSRSMKETACLSFMDIVKAVAKKYPDADVNNLGENDFIVDYILEKKHSKFLQGLLIAFVAAFTFVGSMYAIMAYNNDVSTIEIFEKVYEIFGADNAQQVKLLEITYAVGLALGIIIFYNHFAGVRLSGEPTPIEVEMDKYEKDVDDTLIDRKSKTEQKGKKA